MAGLKALKRVVYNLSAKLNLIGVGSMIVMIIFVMADILGRVLLNKPLSGSYELVEYAMVMVIVFALGYTQVKKGHTDVTTLLDLLPKKVRIQYDRLVNLVGCVMWGLIAWQTIVKAGIEKEAGTASNVLYIPKYPFEYLAGVGFLWLTVVFAIQTLLPEDEKDTKI